jgi:hypothetical protein
MDTLSSRPRCHMPGLPQANQTMCMLNMWAWIPSHSTWLATTR